MSHYAQVIDGIVQQVIVAQQDFIDNYADRNGYWIQTSYNTKHNIHYGPDGEPDGGLALRGNYAGIGYIYDDANDKFYPPKPFPSWTLNTTIWDWQAPVPHPQDGNMWDWDESAQQWVLSQSLGI